MSTPHLRDATPADLNAIVKIDEASFVQPWSRASFEKALADEARTIAIALEVDGALMGFGVAWHVGDEGEIATMAVAEAVRGRRLGETIMRALIEKLTARGARQIFLEVRPSNTAALTLYQKLDFQQVGQRKNYYANGEDAIVMKLTIYD